MIVSASTACFPYDDLETAIDRLVDLEYQRVEIAISEQGRQLKPSEIVEDFERAVQRCRTTQRLTPVAYTLDLEGDGEEFYQHFTACCKLAKATKVVTLNVPAGELGTPFNAEIERLQEMVRIATYEGVVVGLRTEVGHMTEDPDTAVVLCKQVEGLGLTLDPSHYVCGPHSNKCLDELIDYVVHVQLRDSSKDQMQVQIGQGDIEYGKLMAQLDKIRYSRALSVHITEIPDSGVDHFAELRKMRLLLESMLR